MAGMAARRPAPKAIFLDRDGTLIENRHFLRSPDGVALLPGVREALAKARKAGSKFFLFTNQSGVGRGYFTLADVAAVNQRMIEVLWFGDDLFTGICIAPERPDEPAAYRKPSPRFIHETLAEHGWAPEAAWMVGDSPSDWEAGCNAGVCTAALVPEQKSDFDRARWLRMGVEPYSSLLEWASAVFG